MLARANRQCVAVDVHYPPGGGATAALVVAADPLFNAIVGEQVARLDEVAPYRPGSFFDRELPALRAVLQGLNQLDLIIVDGYVDLDPAGRPGLGAHVHREFSTPVIGIAKSRFATASHAVELRRGQAHRPLFITAAGLARDDAARLVARMAGTYRIPDALRRADRLARTGTTGPPQV